MITESKVTEIFCIADDFCKEFEVEMVKKSLPSSADAPKRRRKRMMSDAEVITIQTVSTSTHTVISSITIWDVSANTGGTCSRGLSPTTVLWR